MWLKSGSTQNPSQKPFSPVATLSHTPQFLNGIFRLAQADPMLFSWHVFHSITETGRFLPGGEIFSFWPLNYLKIFMWLCPAFWSSWHFFFSQIWKLTFKGLKGGDYNQNGILLPLKRLESHSPGRVSGSHLQTPRCPQPHLRVCGIHARPITTSLLWHNQATERKTVLSVILHLCLLSESVLFLVVTLLFSCSRWREVQQGLLLMFVAGYT